MTTEQMGGDGAVLAEEIEQAEAAGATATSVILVEGVSDQRAVETLARRRGRDLNADGVAVIPIAGATNVDRFLALLGPGGYDVPLAGLCDEGEEREFRNALERSGLGTDLDRAAMERLGFFVCVGDLEEELIRALGPREWSDSWSRKATSAVFAAFRTSLHSVTKRSRRRSGGGWSTTSSPMRH